MIFENCMVHLIHKIPEIPMTFTKESPWLSELPRKCDIYVYDDYIAFDFKLRRNDYELNIYLDADDSEYVSATMPQTIIKSKSLHNYICSMLRNSPEILYLPIL